MKKNLKKALALVLCLSLCVGILAGCGKEEKEEPAKEETSRREEPRETRHHREETEAPDIYSISAYYDNDELEVSLDFYDDYTFYLSDIYDVTEGTYYFDGEDFVLTLDDEILEGYIVEEGVLSIFDVDGFFYEVEYPTYTPDSSNRISIGDTESQREYEDQGDGTIRYRDYNGDIAITYPDWMTNYEDDLMPGSVLIADTDGGFVLGLNVTDAYWNYEGYDEDFLMELFNYEISDAIDQIFGTEWEASSLTLLENSQDNRVATGEVNFYGDNFDVMAAAKVYHTTKDGEIQEKTLLKVYIYEYGNDAQYQFLKDNIVKCVSTN